MKKKIRWGILSTAKIARNHFIKAIQSADNCELRAISSRSEKKAGAAAETFGIPEYYGSYEAMINSASVDAVYNPLPTSLHAFWSKRCAEAGLPVLCEKPLTADAAEARDLVDFFSERKLLLQEAFMYKQHPMTKRIRRMILDGAVGTLTSMRAVFNANGAGPENIRFQKNLAGGAMGDIGSYCVGVMRHLSGRDPVRVSAFGKFGSETGVDETVCGVLEFPGPLFGYFGCSLRTEFSCQYDISGSGGRILAEQGTVPGSDDTLIKYWHDREYEEILVPGADHYRLLAEYFAGCLLDNREPSVPIEDSVKNMAVIDAVLTSCRETKVVQPHYT